MIEEKNGGKAAALSMLPKFRRVAAMLDADPATLSYLEEAHTAAVEMPLEVLGRTGWQNANGSDALSEGFDEYQILFAWGGPAVRAYKVAGGTWELQGQDWGTPWERVYIEDDADLRAFDRVCDYILEANAS